MDKQLKDSDQATEIISKISPLKSISNKFMLLSFLFMSIVLLVLGGISIMVSSSSLNTIMDSRGNAMASYIAKSSRTFFQYQNHGALEDYVVEISNNPDVVYAVFYDNKGEPVTETSVKPSDTRGILIFNQDVLGTKGDILGSISIGYSTKILNNTMYTHLVTMGLCTFFALIGLLFCVKYAVSKFIEQPLKAAHKIAEQLSEGDLTGTIEYQGEDEIGSLMSALRNMLLRFSEIVGKVVDSTKRVNASATEISKAVQEQAVVASQQSSSVVEITSTMEELSASSSQIAEHSNSVASVAEKTFNSTQKSVDVFGEFALTMREIFSDNKNSINEIVELGSKSSEVTHIMEIINNIADQTKLIAFNAALEASSAGEAGKRFGVVASEIRRLADSVMESTGEIETKINEIQEAINRLVISSEKGSKGIEKGFKFSEEIGFLLEEIAFSSDSTTSLAKQISMSTQQQKTASDQVVTAIREIADGARKSSESIGSMTSVSTSLADLSSNLIKIVEHFKTSDNTEDPGAL